MTVSLDRVAQTDSPILDVLAERWSTRIFDPAATLDEAALASALEAARWSPSANNTQPWRFIVTRRGTAEYDAVLATLAGFNKNWAGNAGAFVVALAQTVAADGAPVHYAQYDTGQAVAHFTVQAHAGGLATHQMGGFDRAALKEAFGLGDNVAPLTVVAVGTLGSFDDAPEEILARESAPRTRRPLAESVIVDA